MDLYYKIEQYLEQQYDCVATIYDGDELDYTHKEGVIKVRGLNKDMFKKVEDDLQNQGYNIVFDEESFRSNKSFESPEGILTPKEYKL